MCNFFNKLFESRQNWLSDNTKIPNIAPILNTKK